ncbi:hypothetical protein PR048_000183 [Dryococelus australis]|uniref:Uncharacterized protein n=1 Tax=Dryococelus australis TaxID=614101 RepID=A0ABQ9IEV1_9NEOP|nr:hypothetical protein PR048_000183 [Dryococelus australis]
MLCACPRWCVVEKSRYMSHAVALIIEGLTLYDFVSHESFFQEVCAHFPNRVEVVVPAQYSGSLVRELAIVPLATAFRRELVTGTQVSTNHHTASCILYS